MISAQEFVFEAIDNINRDSSIETKIDKNEIFLLLDKESTIDSLTLVNLFVEIETIIEKRLYRTISIVNEDSFDSNEYPFRDIGSLIKYLQTLLNK